jgi:hypothetical protein
VCPSDLDDRHQPLVIADVRFVGANKVHVGQLMGHDAEQVARDSVGVEPDNPLFVVGHAFAQFL